MAEAAPLGERLVALQSNQYESRIAFLGRMAHIAACNASEAVELEQIPAIQGHMPQWQFLHLRPYIFARKRLDLLEDQQIPPFPEVKSLPQWLGDAKPNILLLAKHYVTGGFLSKVIRADLPDLSLLPDSPQELLRGTYRARNPGTVELRGLLYVGPYSHLQEKVLRFLAFPDRQIATNAGVTPNSIRHYFAELRKSNGMTNREFVLGALMEGRIDLSPLPPNRPGAVSFTEDELRLLSEESFSFQTEAIERVGISRQAIVRRWAKIYEKIGVRSQREAFLWSVHHGYIKLDEEILQGKSKFTEKLELTETQREVVWRQALTLVDIGKELSISESAISDRLLKALKRHNMTEEEFVRQAYSEGLIDVRRLPPMKSREFSLLEKEILSKCTFMTSEEAGTVIGLGKRAIEQHWRSIHKNCKVNTRRAAFLMALRDGDIK